MQDTLRKIWHWRRSASIVDPANVGAFFDDEINSIVDIDGTEESAIYLSVVGHPKFPKIPENY